VAPVLVGWAAPAARERPEEKAALGAKVAPAVKVAQGALGLVQPLCSWES